MVRPNDLESSAKNPAVVAFSPWGEGRDERSESGMRGDALLRAAVALGQAA